MSEGKYTVKMYLMTESGRVPYRCSDKWAARTLANAKKQIRNKRVVAGRDYLKYWFHVTGPKDTDMWFCLKPQGKRSSTGIEVREHEVYPPELRDGIKPVDPIKTTNSK